jgi:hypothetical protein
MFAPIRLSMAAALVLFVACSCWAQRSAEEAYPADPDPFMGDYVGRWSDDVTVNPEIAAQIIPLGNDNYRIRVVNKLDMRCPPLAIVEVSPENGKLAFEADGMKGETDGRSFTGGGIRGESTFRMEKVIRTSPTLGRQAPEGATILFDGSNLDAWSDAKGWSVADDGSMLVDRKGEDIRTKGAWKDLELHIEFNLPYMPRARSQQRGNSGIFLQNIYEVQVLDSFGLEGYYDDCGALYKLSAPHVNATYPPGQWQTYDITYTAPKYDESGKLAENGRMTVHHNGVLIHADQELKWITAWTEEERKAAPPRDAAPIRIQCHGDFMKFRNIWLVAGE